MITSYRTAKYTELNSEGITEIIQYTYFTYSEGTGRKNIGDCMYISVENGFRRISEDCVQALYLNNRQISIRTVDVEILPK